MTRHGAGMRSLPCLMVGMACLAVYGSTAAWAKTGSSGVDERGPRLQITAPGKMARLPRPPQEIDRMPTASIAKISPEERVERAFGNPTKSEVALGLVPDWTAPALVTHLTPSSVARLQAEGAAPAPDTSTQRPVPKKAVDPTLAFLAFPLGDEKALPLERMGGGYLASYVPEPLLQIEPEETAVTPPAMPDAPKAPSQALTKPPESLPATPSEAQPTPPEPQPEATVAPPKQPAAETATPPDAKEEARSAKTEAPAARSQPPEPELPPSLLPTRPPLAPG